MNDELALAVASMTYGFAPEEAVVVAREVIAEGHPDALTQLLAVRARSNAWEGTPGVISG